MYRIVSLLCALTGLAAIVNGVEFSQVAILIALSGLFILVHYCRSMVQNHDRIEKLHQQHHLLLVGHIAHQDTKIKNQVSSACAKCQRRKERRRHRKNFQKTS